MTPTITALRANATSHATPALIVNLFQGVTSPGGATGAADRALSGLISRLISDGEIRGRSGELTLIHTPPSAYPGFAPSRVLVAGLGPAASFDYASVRSVAAESLRRLERSGISSAATILHGAGVAGLDAALCAEALAEGAALGAYRFDRYRSPSEETAPRLQSLQIVEHDASRIPAIEEGVRRGVALAGAANMARDMVNEPANVFTPSVMAEQARSLAASLGLSCSVLEREDVQALGMGAYLGVAAGSAQPPKFIHLTYNGDPSRPANAIWYVGKGITFDSGGISIKPAENMGDMKGDMGGGAAVIASLHAIAALRPRINVHAVVAATENMPGGAAQRPGDIVRAMNGKFIEIDNTDAEGRLTLADAISYAKSKGATRIVDVATLTGAARIALGTGNAAAFTNNDALLASFLAAAGKRGEPFWRLPLDATSKRQNASKVADIKNTGGRAAGSITAAHFIAEFAGDTPWVHLDIAALNLTDTASGPNVPGATGIPARTLAQLAMDLASQ
jgi:leucyl aminopeptidase